MTQLTGVLMTADLEQVRSQGVTDTRVVTSD